jgi:hypothetical protein
MALVGSQGHHPVDHGLYLAKMWPRERTKVIMVKLVSRRRTMAVFHHRQRVFRSLYLL